MKFNTFGRSALRGAFFSYFFFLFLAANLYFGLARLFATSNQTLRIGIFGFPTTVRHPTNHKQTREDRRPDNRRQRPKQEEAGACVEGETQHHATCCPAPRISFLDYEAALSRTTMYIRDRCSRIMVSTWR